MSVDLPHEGAVGPGIARLLLFEVGAEELIPLSCNSLVNPHLPLCEVLVHGSRFQLPCDTKSSTRKPTPSKSPKRSRCKHVQSQDWARICLSTKLPSSSSLRDPNKYRILHTKPPGAA